MKEGHVGGGGGTGEQGGPCKDYSQLIKKCLSLPNIRPHLDPGVVAHAEHPEVIKKLGGIGEGDIRSA